MDLESEKSSLHPRYESRADQEGIEGIAGAASSAAGASGSTHPADRLPVFAPSADEGNPAELIDRLRRQQEALKESEERFRSLFNSMTEGFALHEILIDATGRPCDYRFIDINPAFEKLTGLKRADILGKRVSAILPGIEPYWIETYGKVVLSGEPVHLENFSTPLHRWYEVFAYRSAPGTFAVIFTDITARKQAEDALREALSAAEAGARILDTLMEFVPEGITIADGPDGVIRMVSRAGRELLGRRHEGMSAEAVAEKWRVYHANGVTPMAADDLPLVRAIRQGDTIRNLELVQMNEEGRRLHLLCNAAPIRSADGNVSGGIVAWRDITDRKKAEEALRASEERYRRMFETMTEGVVYQDADGSIIEMNPAAEEILGKSATQLQGESSVTVEQDCVREDGSPFPGLEHPSMIALQTSREVRNVVMGVFNPREGRRRWIEINAVPLFTADESRPRQVYTVFSDITERIRAEQALRNANEQLEQRVRDRTVELARRAAQLRALAGELTLAEQRERRRMAKLLHDHLQQLLVGAKFRAAILGRHAEPLVQQAAEEIEKLVDDAISSSRSLTAELSPPILHERGLAAGLEWLANWMADKHGLTVDLSLEEDVPLPAEDVKVLLFESVRELLFNAVKHAQVRSATVSMRRIEDNALQVTVGDAGRGFDPAARQPAGPAGGGIGLFSIRERLGLLGGRMEIESTPGKGSRFALVVPLGAPGLEDPDVMAADSVFPARPGGDVPQYPGARRSVIRVMLADDHGVVRQSLARLLSAEPDIEIVGEAADGLAAVELARTLAPDVVLMDLSMPRLNGIDATRMIHATLPHVRVIGLSMFEEPQQARAMIDAGAAAYLTKSGPADSLVMTIRSCAASRSSVLEA